MLVQCEHLSSVLTASPKSRGCEECLALGDT
jgi:hypothetical protein